MGWQPVLPETVQAGDATYTAQWLINQYMVTFDANGGVGGKSGKQDYGSAIAAPTVTREGYTFTGWTPEVTETVPTNDVTYTAQWQINQYTVTFNANGGTGGTTKTQNYGTSLSAPTVTRMGYTFTGWLPNVPSTMPAENMTYTAQWQINQYTATFNANGGTGGTTKMQNYGTSLTAPTVTRDGYTFRGWAPSVPSAMPAENETYTAQWEVQYTVTFNANGGMGGWSKKLDRGSALVAPKVTREWFEPAGWQPVVPATVPANDVTYTAQWRRWGDSISAAKMGGKTMKQLYPNDYDHMTEVVLEEGVTELPEGFFDGCEALVELTLPSTLDEFGLDDLPPRIKESQAFDDDGFMVYNGWLLGCNDDYLEELVVPEGIVGIGRGAFQEQFSLLRVTFPFSMRSVSANAFLGCVSLNELNANSGLRHVGDSAFEDCISLPVLELVDGLVSIGACAFKNNAQLNSVRLPLSVGNIAADAFLECAAVRGVILPTKVRPLSALFPESYAQIEDVEVVAGETEIMTGMFAGCRSLRSVQLAESVTNLGAYAFQECTALSEIVLPDGVESMGPGVFRGCSSLTGITLSSVLTVISDEAFLGCTSLASLIVPASVSYLGRSFFSGHEVHYQGNAPDHDENAYPSGLGDLRSFALTGTKGWYAKYPGAAILPPDRSWCGYPIAYEVPPVFDVTFVANGGQFANGEAEYPVSQRTGNKYVFPADPARPGWIFMGWRRMADGGAEIIPGKTDVTATASHRVYADWQSMDERVTVAFNANGGTEVEPREYVPGLTYGGFPVPTRTGYKFQGWWTAAGIEVTESSEVAESVRVLTAHWLPISYIVRFLANGADNPVEMMHQPFTYDARQRLWTNRFERTGFNFAGWAVRPDGDVKYTDCEEVANLAQKQGTVVDLHAVWHGEGYSVQFKAMGGEGRMEPQTIRIGETRALWSNVFTKEGYVFAGWDVDERGTNVVYRDAEEVLNLSLTNRDDVPLYAVWKRRDETATIMFNANGGSVAPVYWGCVVGTAVEAFPLPSRPGFDFAGWYTAITNGELVSAVNPVTKDEVYYAHWVETGIIVPGPAICTAMFNANGGSLGTNAITVAVTAGSTIGALPTPARIGHVFTGWFTAADGGIQVFSETVVDSSVTYYAHWESDGQQGSSYVVPASVTGSAAIEISADWPRMFGAFEEKFGTDIAEALQKTTGKLNADGSPLHVWQDYVAGTDPTDTNSVFRVQIKMNATVPEISWTPDLNTHGLERIYTIWGKESLMDGAWTTPTNSAHRFFKVTVEMP